MIASKRAERSPKRGEADRKRRKTSGEPSDTSAEPSNTSAEPSKTSADRKETSRARPLDRDSILQIALALADEDGVEKLTMRRLAAALGVEAMSLYHHFPNKDAILDGMVDRVFAKIELPSVDDEWKFAMRRRAASIRGVLLGHRWAIPLMDSRTSPGMATLRHHDATLGCLRRSGFSVPLAAHAYAVLDAFIYGFIHSEINLPFETGQDARDLAQTMLGQMPEDEFPYLVELTREHVAKEGYAYSDEFDRGLELILDGLERALGTGTPLQTLASDSRPHR